MLFYMICRWLRQHPKVLGMTFKKGVKRAEMSNVIDVYVGGTVGKDMETAAWESMLEGAPDQLTQVRTS